MHWSLLWQESSAEEYWNYLPKFACSSILNNGEKRDRGDQSWRPNLLGCMKACHMHEHWTDCILAILKHWFMLWQKQRFLLRGKCLEACRETFWNWKFETQQYLESWWERKKGGVLQWRQWRPIITYSENWFDQHLNERAVAKVSSKKFIFSSILMREAKRNMVWLEY